jgi:prevent-host-death family protein
MKTISLSEAKLKLSGLVESVSATHEEIMITKNGFPAAVLISHDEFESLKDTIVVRSDESLMNDIKKGQKLLKSKKAELYPLDELFK